MNKKRGRKNQVIKLGTFKLTRKDIINLEKIILKRLSPSDHYVLIGRQKSTDKDPSRTFSSARYLPKTNRVISYLRIEVRSPNISVEFTPYTTMINAQRIYSKGERLDKIHETVDELNKYLNEQRGEVPRFYKRLLRNKIYLK